MQIQDFRLSNTAMGVRASARIAWEEVDRPPLEAFFETDGGVATDPRAFSNAFLLAAFVPAIRAGERRVRVEGAAVCPLLREGLHSVSALLRAWWGPSVEPEIESPEGFRAVAPTGPAALFLSGGADSLHLLQQNVSVYPNTHGNAFREAIHFLGMALFEDDPTEAALNLADRGRGSAQRIARSCGLTLRTVQSNVARLSGDHYFWASHTQGAMLASVALGQPVRSASLASSWDFRYTPPWGSHPYLDPCYSSSAVEIRHCGVGFSRLAKLAALGNWPVALENMVVCHQGPLPAGGLNCGRCEKCLRTMIELLIGGALDRATAFPVRRVTAEMVDRLDPMDLPSERFWTDLIEPLDSIGRHDLARATRAFLARIRRQRRWESNRGWKGGLRKFDREFLGGSLLRLKQACFR